MWITHSYMGTTRNGTRCLFFLLFEDYIDAQRGLDEKVKIELERFARNLGDSGAVVLPFAGDSPPTHQSVVDKRWSEQELEELRKTPSMLMIDTDFNGFDPRRDSWALFHFDRSRSYDGSYPGKLRSLFQKLTEATSNPSLNPFSVVKDSLRNDAIARASKIFNLEPRILGVSIDLKAGWAELKEYLRKKKR